MAYAVTTYNDEKELATALTAVVTTFPDEDKLDVGLAAATSVTTVVAKGGKFTLIDNAQIVNVSLVVLAKGAKFTVILETA
jgi:hypothetical protein